MTTVVALITVLILSGLVNMLFWPSGINVFASGWCFAVAVLAILGLMTR